MDFILKKEGVFLVALCFFPALKTLTLIATGYGGDYMFDSLISGCPVLEELYIRYGDVHHRSDWMVLVSGQSIKRLTISSVFSTEGFEFDRTNVLFEIPSLLYLDYSGYVQEYYIVDFGSLLEARLDLRLWELSIEFHFDYANDVPVNVFGDVTTLVAGLSNVKTLHLSPHSLEGLGHKVTGKCGDVCACILQKNEEEEKEEGCLWRCQVKVLEITGYGGSCKELRQMRHFLEKLKGLENVKIGVQQENNNHGEYLRVTNDLMKLPRV